MKASIVTSLNNLRKSVTCSICLEYFNNPLTLSCGHCFCQQCIEPVLNDKKLCPICSSMIRRRNIVSEHELSTIISEISIFIERIFEKIMPAPVTPNESLPRLSDLPNAANEENHSAGQTDVSLSLAAPGIPIPALASATVLSQHQDVTKLNSSKQSFRQGDLVTVASRTYAGMNKLGGTGRVCAVHMTDTNYFTYSVKYVLDNTTENELDECYITLYKELDPSTRRQRHTETNNTLSTSASTCTDARASKRKRSNEDTDINYYEHNLTIINRSVPMPTITSKPPIYSVVNFRKSNIVLLSTALDPYLQSKLTLLAERCEGVSVTNSFSETVTHLVVSVDKQRILKNRTMKYLQAVIKGRWIVSVDWVQHSLRKGVLLREEEYEVYSNGKASIPDAPRRARLSMWQKEKGLFSGFAAILVGQFALPGPSKSDISYLLEAGGAVICTNLNECLLSYHASDSGDERTYRTTQERRVADGFVDVVVVAASESAVAEYQLQQQITNSALTSTVKKAPVVLYSWVLDCIVNYQLIRPTDFISQSTSIRK